VGLWDPINIADVLMFIFSDASSVGFALPGLCTEERNAGMGELCGLAEKRQIGRSDGYAAIRNLLGGGDLDGDLDYAACLDFATGLVRARGGTGTFPNGMPFQVYNARNSDELDHIYIELPKNLDPAIRFDPKRMEEKDFLIPVYPLRLYSGAPCVTGSMHSGEKEPPHHGR